MTSKPMPTSQDNPSLETHSALSQRQTADVQPSTQPNSQSNTSAGAPLSLDSIIEAQVGFMQQWLGAQADTLSVQACQWFGEQPLCQYLQADDLKRLINDGLLQQPMSDVMRTDIRDILHTVIYHPINDNVLLSELIDDTQVETLASCSATPLFIRSSATKPLLTYSPRRFITLSMILWKIRSIKQVAWAN